MKTLFKIVLWLIFGLFAFFFGVAVGQTMDEVEVDTPVSVDISGVWSPVEMAKGKLTFQYGVCTHHTPSFGGEYVDREYPYTIKGNHLYLQNKYFGIHPTSTIDCEIAITEDGYLEIKNVTGFAGKYKRVNN